MQSSHCLTIVTLLCLHFLYSFTLSTGVEYLNTTLPTITAQKMKFSITDFFSKCDQIRRCLWIWSHLLKKSVMENFIFCVVNVFFLTNYFAFAIGFLLSKSSLFVLDVFLHCHFPCIHNQACSFSFK